MMYVALHIFWELEHGPAPHDVNPSLLTQPSPSLLAGLVGAKNRRQRLGRSEPEES